MNSFNKKKYIVTGCAGFIGSNLTDRLLKDGHKVIGVDNLSSGFKDYLQIESSNFIFLEGNIVNYEFLSRSKKLFNDVFGVFHVAAQSRIQPAIQNPFLAHSNNITGIFNILEIMRDCDIPRMVFSSSSSIYGLKNDCPQREDMEPDCLNPYSLSKYVGEQYIKTWCKLYGIDGCSLRYFNVWGPREVIHLKDIAPIVGLFFRKILLDKVPLTIVGEGSQRRDHTYVSDVVEANVLTMNYKERMNGEVFNIGTGKNYTILELAEMVLKSLGMDESHIEYLPPRPGESRATKANNTKAKEWFGWEPKVFLEQQIENHKNYYLNKWNLNSI